MAVKGKRKAKKEDSVRKMKFREQFMDPDRWSPTDTSTLTESEHTGCQYNVRNDIYICPPYVKGRNHGAR